MMRATLSTFGLFIGLLPAFSAASEQGLRQIALKEAWAEGIAVTSASDAQTSGLLTLEDPGLRESKGPWDWALSFSLQAHRPEGSAPLAGGLSSDFSRNGSTLLPGVKVGLQRPIFSEKIESLRVGVHLGAAYASQKTSLDLPIITVEDVRVSSFRSEIGAGLMWGFARRMQLEAGLAAGFYSLSQSSKNDVVNYSQQARWNGYSLAYWYALQPNWALGIEQTRRELQGSYNIGLAPDATAVQTRFTW